MLVIDKTIDMGALVEQGIRVLGSLDVVDVLGDERIGLGVVGDGQGGVTRLALLH